jgi:hypothetical protein
LDHDRSVLNGGEQCLALGDRQAEVFRSFGRLRERGDLLDCASTAIVIGELEQDPDAHGAPPMPNADERAFHNRRSAKLKASPAR